MKVVIVAKTHMGGGACIGALSLDGRSLRLIAPDAEFNDHFNQEYAVGDVWDIETRPPDTLIPPHTENVIVRRKHRLPPLGDLDSFVRERMPPLVGGPEVLYGGLAQRAGRGALYIAERTGVPGYSTLFWQPDRPLRRETEGKRIRYRYGDDGGVTLVFVGFQEPVDVIPAGSLVRVSLAHWWRPAERPEEELRCYVQLSGWIPSASGSAADVLPAARPVKDRVSVSQQVDLTDAQTVLKRVYGYDDFRPLQAEIIDNLLNKRDTLAVMPTGSGKSLCYQLPALLSPGLTVVVSPLISLMEDQVMQLRELGVPAAYLNSTLGYDVYLATTREIRAGRVKLVYAAPETLLRPETLLLLEECPVDCFTIDEAHCISEWGHDFRPEFRQLIDVRRRVPDAVCLAVTATATGRVRADIKSILDIPDADEFLAGFDRENLFLAAQPRVNGFAQTMAFLEAHRGESGIIYCWTRETADTLAAGLASRGWAALPYHAGLDSATRRENQRRFSFDETPIIVATIAFGMGINKSNVRFVLHYDLPKDLESYYQQVGRAGRDGLRADCLLLYSRSDVATASHFIDQMAPALQIGATMRLRAMLDFAETDECRRRPLLAYFGDTYDRERCGLCDNCLKQSEPSDLTDLTIAAQKFLSCVKRTGEIFGVNYIVDVLRGSQSQKVLSRGHDRLSTYGIGREYSAKQWQALARQFVRKGLLTQDIDHGNLEITSKGWAVMRGERYMGTPPADERPTWEQAADESFDKELFELLRARRQDIARESGLPPYVIFHDTALRDMATYFPQSRDSFMSMSGVGERKAEKYADAFLAVIRPYCAEHELAERPKWERPAPVTREPSLSGLVRREQIAESFNEGERIADISQELGLKDRTIIKYLWDYVRAGGALRADYLRRESQLSAEEQARVSAVFAELGTDLLRPVFDALNETVSFDELHLMRMIALMEGD